MERLCVSSSSVIDATLVAGTAQRFTLPLRLAQNKVALLKKVIFQCAPYYSLSDGAGLYLALLNRPMRDVDVGTGVPNMESWVKGGMLIASYMPVTRWGTNVGFQNVWPPHIVDIPEPYIPARHDLTVAIDGVSGLVRLVVQVYYEQKSINLEDWQKLAKEYT